MICCYGNVIFNCIMAADNQRERLSLSDIFINLLSCSEKESIVGKTIHVYDPKELQTGWQSASCNVKYLACPTGEREQASPSMKSDLPKKRNKKLKEKQGEENGYEYDKLKSLGVLSYAVPSWRTIVNPETNSYIDRRHPCLYNTTEHKNNDLKGLSFVDPASVLDQHLGGFVQRQQASNWFKRNSEVDNMKKYNQFRMSQNNLKPIVEERPEYLSNDPVSTKMTKPHSLKPLPATKSMKSDLHSSSISLRTKNFPSALLQNKYSTIDKRNGWVHHEILHSQKIKLEPFKQQITPTNFVQKNKKQKLNWLPITTTSPCLPRSSGQSEIGKPAWSEMAVGNHLKERMEVKQ